MYQAVFKRYETKYILDTPTVDRLKTCMAAYMRPDRFGNSTVCNVYLDTPDYVLIRRSLEKPIYKEKLRLRSYGIAKDEHTVFCEIKKKYRSVVYKRRLALPAAAMADCLAAHSFPDSQIGREIAFCFERYRDLAPRMFLSYEREAFAAMTDEGLRITLDKNILWRDNDLSLGKGVYGNRILPPGAVLLEVKTATAMPLWLVRFLSENRIYKTSFSKYGNAYTAMRAKQIQGGSKSA